MSANNFNACAQITNSAGVITDDFLRYPVSKWERNFSVMQNSKNMALKYAHARIRRCFARGIPLSHIRFYNKFHTRDFLRTRYRSLIITAAIVGKTVMVHNGQKYVPLLIRARMIYTRLGEYVLTRKRPVHKGAKKQKKIHH